MGSEMCIRDSHAPDFVASASNLTCRFCSSPLSSSSAGDEARWMMDVPATYISPVAVECTSPAYPLADATSHVSKLVGVAVSLNGQDFTSDPVQFQYRPEPIVHTISPVRGLASGGTVLTVTGENFVDAGSDLLCRFQVERLVETCHTPIPRDTTMPTLDHPDALQLILAS